MANGWATIADADAMYPEQLWDALEAMDVIADAAAHERLHLIRPKNPGKR